MATWLITGASRGIGLAMVRELLSMGETVIATCRNPEGCRDLWELAADYKSRLKYLQLDVAVPSSISQLANDLRGHTIDVLVNNAGVLKGKEEPYPTINLDEVVKSFDVNTLGPMRVTQSLLPNLLLSKNPKIINISSKMGSISDNQSGGYYGYRMSKTALNMFNSCFAKEYSKITSLVVHPGWVKTDMGGDRAPTEPNDSVKGILKIGMNATLKDSGRFIDFTGKELPW